jgi:hypothetical protein
MLAAVNGLGSAPCSSRLARKLVTTVVELQELHEVMEKYCRADVDFRMKSEVQISQTLGLCRGHNRDLRTLATIKLVNVNTIDNTPPLNEKQPQPQKAPMS